MKYWMLLLAIIVVGAALWVRQEVVREGAESTAVATARVRAELKQEFDSKLDTMWNHLLYSYRLPDTIIFCQRVPLERPVVCEKVEREFFRFLRQRPSLVWWYRQYGLYDSLFRASLREAGLPEELAIMPVLEGLLDPRAESHAGAAGLWQFMPETGDGYALKRTVWSDLRQDIVRSTQAASRHLVDLYALSKLQREGGDWWLALAQYVCSPKAVNAAIRRQGHRDYFTLKITKRGDAERYVPQLIALHVLFTHPREFGLDVVSQYDPLPPLVDTLVYLPKGGTVFDLAHAAGVTMDDLYTFSPAYLGELLPAQTKFHVWKSAPTMQ